MIELPPLFWPLAGRIVLLIALEAVFALAIKRLRRGSSTTRSTIWMRGATFIGVATLFFVLCAAGVTAFACFLAVIGILAIREVAAVLARAGRPRLVALAGALAYIGIPFALLVLVRGSGAGFALVIWTTAIVGFCDVTSMFGGLAFGRRRLAPLLSPGKTVEGTIIGLCGALVVAAVLRFALPAAPAAVYYATALLVAVMGNAGDLFASLLKRSAAVKDFGAALPGHGGVVDRIDSLLFAAPTVWLTLLLFHAP